MPFGIGHYPAEFNPKIHGPYNPARKYGKPDTAISQVKLGELPGWIGRRSMDPLSMVRAVGRSWQGWRQRWFLVKSPGFAPVGQLMMGMTILWYLRKYNFLKYHAHAKYH